MGRFLVVAVVFAGIVSLGTLVTQRSAAVRAASPDSATGPTMYGRYRVQRDASVAMRADLLSLVALDSTLVRDSAYPGSFLQRAELLRASAGNMGPYVHRTPRGWWATIRSMYSGITCAVALGPDTTIRDTPSGSPVCYGPDWN